MTAQVGVISEPRPRHGGLLALFAGTLFTSAFLVFWIQPLFAKMALPLLGGVPAVWNTAMVFFQATLLAAYAYAHVISTRLSGAQQCAVHGLVILAAALFLPIGVQSGVDPAGLPLTELLILLAISVGAPFFAVSATAPLLQRWFSRTDHPDAADPYFLYSASNLGSILALVSFPFLIEPALGLAQQGLAWGLGFALLVLMMTACGRAALQDRNASHPAKQAQGLEERPASWRQRGHWVALAFAPSALLLGVTGHITTDLAAVPLLWVAPLTLYLLTYVIVFARRPLIRHAWVIKLQPYALILAFFFLFSGALNIVSSVLVHLAVFFILTLACHGELVRRRPAAFRLTEFYIFMSLGGVLGGAFIAILAPLLFDGVYEYPIAIAAACLLRPGESGGARRSRWLDLLLPAALAVAAILFYQVNEAGIPLVELVWPVLLLRAAIAVFVFGAKHRPMRFGLAVAAALLAAGLHSAKDETLLQDRSFFGVHRVAVKNDGQLRILTNGTTLHGSQLTDPAFEREPTSYYIRAGALGQLFKALPAAGRTPRHIALVGLGAGASLCHARPGQHWDIFEIDPTVVHIARDSGYFTYWRTCLAKATAQLHLGDARLRMDAVPESRFDLMILDAYSSDAIPVHLLTREAMATYLSKLAPGGLIAFHLSNRHLDLQPLLAALLDEFGLAGRTQTFKPPEAIAHFGTEAAWVVVARHSQDLAGIADGPAWRALVHDPTIRAWTDDFSNIVQVLR